MDFKSVTHKERKEFLKAVQRISKEFSEDEVLDELTKFREGFLKAHLKEDVDLDSLPAKKVDEMLKELEGELDFSMGINQLVSMNTERGKGR